MIDWILKNLPTILICLGLIALLAAIIRSMIRDRKHKKNTCGYGCSSCHLSGQCPSMASRDDKK
ncbi:MAG: FeoB-associated Cys-rich membrane protein [Tissierellia bacterium]|nr:FeoB-associated Cys-rich membrane protein [Tissierellia bacterium]